MKLIPFLYIFFLLPFIHSLKAKTKYYIDKLSNYLATLNTNQTINETSDFNSDSLTNSIVSHYELLFNQIDTNQNNLISQSELSSIAKEFKWPHLPIAKDLTFVDFCDYMEKLWTIKDIDYTTQCDIAYKKSVNVFSNLFTFIDRDNDNKITKKQISLALSAIFNKQISINEIEKVFTSNEISKNEFILSIANGKTDSILLNIVNYDISHISTFL